MKENLELTKGTIMAEAVITELVNKESAGRTRTRFCALRVKALSERKDLKEILLAGQNGFHSKIKKSRVGKTNEVRELHWLVQRKAKSNC